MKPIVAVLKRGRDSGKEGAAGTLRNLAGSSRACKQAVVAAGAIPALVESIRRGEIGTRRAAAWALTNLAANEPEIKVAIAAEGAVKPLVELLRNSPSSSAGTGAKEAAAVRAQSAQHTQHALP